ncbi:MAG: hypothetical protein ACE5IA_07055 [Dehalococcoidia bacterium]
MAKCPKCGAEIANLRNFTLHWTEYCFEVREDGSPSYTTDSVCFSDPVESEYVCPGCHEVLFKSEPEAIGFLKG